VNDRKLLRLGIIGTVVTAVCCFTPLLLVLLGALGLSALAGGLDYLLLPALAGFVALTLYALVRRLRHSNPGHRETSP
jgi:mercuric ion transport protein